MSAEEPSFAQPLDGDGFIESYRRVLKGLASRPPDPREKAWGERLVAQRDFDRTWRGKLRAWLNGPYA